MTHLRFSYFNGLEFIKEEKTISDDFAPLLIAISECIEKVKVDTSRIDFFFIDRLSLSNVELLADAGFRKNEGGKTTISFFFGTLSIEDVIEGNSGNSISYKNILGLDNNIWTNYIEITSRKELKLILIEKLGVVKERLDNKVYDCLIGLEFYNVFKKRFKIKRNKRYERRN